MIMLPYLTVKENVLTYMLSELKHELKTNSLVQKRFDLISKDPDTLHENCGMYHYLATHLTDLIRELCNENLPS